MIFESGCAAAACSGGSRNEQAQPTPQSRSDQGAEEATQKGATGTASTPASRGVPFAALLQPAQSNLFLPGRGGRTSGPHRCCQRTGKSFPGDAADLVEASEQDHRSQESQEKQA